MHSRTCGKICWDNLWWRRLGLGSRFWCITATDELEAQLFAAGVPHLATHIHPERPLWTFRTWPSIGIFSERRKPKWLTLSLKAFSRPWNECEPSLWPSAWCRWGCKLGTWIASLQLHGTQLAEPQILLQGISASSGSTQTDPFEGQHGGFRLVGVCSLCCRLWAAINDRNGWRSIAPGAQTLCPPEQFCGEVCGEVLLGGRHWRTSPSYFGHHPWDLWRVWFHTSPLWRCEATAADLRHPADRPFADARCEVEPVASHRSAICRNGSVPDPKTWQATFCERPTPGGSLGVSLWLRKRPVVMCTFFRSRVATGQELQLRGYDAFKRSCTLRGATTAFEWEHGSVGVSGASRVWDTQQNAGIDWPPFARSSMQCAHIAGAWGWACDRQPQTSGISNRVWTAVARAWRHVSICFSRCRHRSWT